MREIVLEDRPYTFSDYFNLNVDVEQLIGYFGYHFQIEALKLTKGKIDVAKTLEIQRDMEIGLPKISLNSEVARREFLIAPVLWELMKTTDAKLKVEYPLQVDDKLKGTLDYFIQSESKLLIVEAKNADPQRGFNQLATELIALDKWLEDDSRRIYGAVSLGNFWQFSILNRQEKRIVQDVNSYTVPTDIENLLQILVGILAE